VILLEWRKTIAEALLKAGFEDAAQEAKWLLAGALEQESFFVTLNPTYTPSLSETLKIQGWFKRRLKGEPLSRMKKIREFWSLPFHLNEHTLDPRPETEGIIEGVLQGVRACKTAPMRFLDLGTGSGCLLIALLHELKNATGLGIDFSEEALSMARFNATCNGVAKRAIFQQGNWGKDLEGPFDSIVSNPPYIPLGDKKKLSKSVLHFDPALALFGGKDGLDAYRILAQDIKRLLDPKGLAVLEIGYGQRKAVESLFQAVGFKMTFILKDLAGIERIIGMTRLTCGSASIL
jgi:release factor glutamine methyltransferase